MGNFQSSSKTVNKNKPTNIEQRNFNGIFFSSAKIIESYLDNPIPKNEQAPSPCVDSPNSNTLESHEKFDINSIINGDSPDISIAVLHHNQQSNDLSSTVNILENVHFEQKLIQNNKQMNINKLALSKEEHIVDISSFSL